MSITKYQKIIVNECLRKGSGCLSLPMGSGKTLISLIVGLRQTEVNKKPILIVASKTLVGSWLDEIKKFFQDTIQYEVFHKDYLKNKFATWRIDPKTRIVLTTSEVISKAYKIFDIKPLSSFEEQINSMITTVYYVNPGAPLIGVNVATGVIYSTEWGTMIIDEVQNYTNIKTMKCKALGAVCALNRWGLSGTAFPEPIVERILGYYLILNIPGPRSVPDMNAFISGTNFDGLAKTMVKRDTNPDFIVPKTIEEIVSHPLTGPEAKIYIAMKGIMKSLQSKAAEYKEQNDVENARKLTSYSLVLLTFFRQALVCPLIPIASAAVDIVDSKGKSELSHILLDKIESLHLTDWLNDPASICSSRIKKIIEKAAEHKNERILLFSCYRSCINVIVKYLTDRPLFIVEAHMTISQRKEIIDKFSQSPNGILCLSFQIGACGLNLQAASTAIIIDLTWNRDTSKQAAARLLRFGQLAKTIHIIMFTSNTAIEKAILMKQKSKLLMYEDLKSGKTDKKISKINMKEIMHIIEIEENELLLTEVNRLNI